MAQEGSARPRKATRSREKTQGITCDKHRLHVEEAWPGRSKLGAGTSSLANPNRHTKSGKDTGHNL